MFGINLPFSEKQDDNNNKAMAWGASIISVDADKSPVQSISSQSTCR